jgi:hypothetical protein
MNDVTSVTAEDIELSIADARALIKDADALHRLYQNQDFQHLILQGYFKDEPARLAGLKASPAMARPEEQERIIKGIDAIGVLQQYFYSVMALGQNAKTAVEQGEEALVEMENENVVAI